MELLNPKTSIIILCSLFIWAPMAFARSDLQDNSNSNNNNLQQEEASSTQQNPMPFPLLNQMFAEKDPNQMQPSKPSSTSNDVNTGRKGGHHRASGGHHRKRGHHKGQGGGGHHKWKRPKPLNLPPQVEAVINKIVNPLKPVKPPPSPPPPVQSPPPPPVQPPPPPPPVKPPPLPTLVSLGTPPPNSIQKEFLDAHNRVRMKFGEPLYAWSKSLADYAEKWANARMDDCRMIHSAGEHGENLFWGLNTHWTPTEMVQRWVRESETYNSNTNRCEPKDSCLHYTQIIWKDSRSLGCAYVVCSNQKGILGVCEYDPPGNYKDENPFADNIAIYESLD
ncbi:hypothetical protein ACFE04_016304 [Oxalis oulophora]